ncbi:unnamed protein product, partial [Discosporangium mesarthrocarpum]
TDTAVIGEEEEGKGEGRGVTAEGQVKVGSSATMGHAELPQESKATTEPLTGGGVVMVVAVEEEGSEGRAREEAVEEDWGDFEEHPAGWVDGMENDPETAATEREGNKGEEVVGGTAEGSPFAARVGGSATPADVGFSHELKANTEPLAGGAGVGCPVGTDGEEEWSDFGDFEEAPTTTIVAEDQTSSSEGGRAPLPLSGVDLGRNNLQATAEHAGHHIQGLPSGKTAREEYNGCNGGSSGSGGASSASGAGNMFEPGIAAARAGDITPHHKVTAELLLERTVRVCDLAFGRSDMNPQAPLV